MAKPAAPTFDLAAASYDQQFSNQTLGRYLREMVWRRCGQMFAPGDRVLDLGSGTGEDALWLAGQGVHVVGLDASEAMLEIARAKADHSGLTALARFRQLDLNRPDWPDLLEASFPGRKYQGAMSNFGALNCVEERDQIAAALGGLIEPGGYLALTVMGPLCPWEFLWHLLHGEFKTAVRRMRSGAWAHAGAGVHVRTWYPSPRRLRLEFQTYFQTVSLYAIGAFLPPSYLGHLAAKYPPVFSALRHLETSLGGLFPWNWLNDHYLLVLRRRQPVV